MLFLLSRYVVILLAGVVERCSFVRSRDVCLLDSIVLIEQANGQISWISIFTFYGRSGS